MIAMFDDVMGFSGARCIESGMVALMSALRNLAWVRGVVHEITKSILVSSHGLNVMNVRQPKHGTWIACFKAACQSTVPLLQTGFALLPILK